MIYIQEFVINSGDHEVITKSLGKQQRDRAGGNGRALGDRTQPAHFNFPIGQLASSDLRLYEILLEKRNRHFWIARPSRPLENASATSPA